MNLIETLECFWLARAGKNLDSLEPVVRRLSEGFTTGRPAVFADYLSDAKTAAAYGLFFLPQTLARTAEALRGLSLPFTPPTAPFRVLDLGCGSGAASLAAAAFFREHAPEAPLEITAVDHAASALQTVRETFDSVFPGTALLTKAASIDSFAPEGFHDLIVMSFSLNEVFPAPDTERSGELLRRLLAALRPIPNGFPPLLLVLEPAGTQTSPRLQKLRDRFAVEGASIYGPCPHAAPCPLTGLCQGYCHDARRFRPTASMNDLNRHLHRTINDIKYSFLALGNQRVAHDSRRFRLIGPVDKAKGRLLTRICLGDGTLRQIELPAKALTSERRHDLLDQQRGDTGTLAGEPSDWKSMEGGRVLRVPDLIFQAD